jgi:hypothetical protein
MKIVRYGVKTIAWIAGILILIWMILLLYVNINERKLISKISETVHEHTRGEVMIGGLSVSLIRTFPALSLQLTDITLRDSLFAVHKQDFFTARDIYLSFDLSDLVTGRPSVGRVLVRNGSINIITDSTGFTNEYVLKRRNKEPKALEEQPSYPTIVMQRVMVTYINPLRNKHHQAMLRNLKCAIREKDKMLTMKIGMHLDVKGITFNTDKGGYLKAKILDGNFTLLFDKRKQDLVLNNIRIDIDNHPFYFNGKFHIEKVSPDFNLSINTYKIKYDKAVSIVSDTIQSRLNFYSFNKPLDIFVELNGKTLYKYTPAARIIMDIDLASANNFGSTVLDLAKGKAAVNILLNGPVGRGDSILDKIEGKIDITNAEVKYIPRDFTLTNLNGTLKFLKDDFIVENFRANAGKTQLQINAMAKNFVSMLNKQPEKTDLLWKIYSPTINLEDFRFFLSPTQAQKAADRKKNGQSASSQLDKMFTEGDVFVLFETPKMQYKTFKATGVKADVVFKKSEIVLQNVSLKHANGTMEVNGNIQNGKQSNPVTLRTRMQHMDIPQLFAAFDNFGQDAITSKNLKGTLSANVEYRTAVTNEAKIVTSASEGKIDFILENGELNNFEPLQEVGNKVFKKQDFSRISFANLENTLDVKGTAFIVNPMDIRSTALNLSVEGIYDYKKGTDMSIRLPLRNLTKSQANTDLSDGAKAKKGVSLRLRARTGEDGKLKISWDPFRRSIKNKEDVRDSADLEN